MIYTLCFFQEGISFMKCLSEGIGVHFIDHCFGHLRCLHYNDKRRKNMTMCAKEEKGKENFISIWSCFFSVKKGDVWEVLCTSRALKRIRKRNIIIMPPNNEMFDTIDETKFSRKWNLKEHFVRYGWGVDISTIWMSIKNMSIWVVHYDD